MKRKYYLKRLIYINLPILLLTLLYVLLFYTVLGDGEISLCVMKEKMHLYCPGCGGSRALISLLNFDLIESFIYYPPLLILVLIILELDFRLILCIKTDSSKYIERYTCRRFYIFAFFVILTFIIRNILLFFGVDLIGDIHRI